jgi:UDP-N-acetylglucosamine 2-epimerase
MVGNSSSGLREAPSFGLPFVCVGDRQAGRERGDNVLDVRAERAAIARALDTALDDAGFRHRVAHASNPFGDGRAGERVAGLLASVELGPRLLRKSLGAGPDS